MLQLIVSFLDFCFQINLTFVCFCLFLFFIATFVPNKYNYDEDWGEKYEGVSRLGLYVLDLENKVTKEIPGINIQDTVGQPIFTPCSGGIVYTAWLGSYRKLGMIYCYQRPCEIRLVRSIESIFQSLQQTGNIFIIHPLFYLNYLII